MTDAKQLTGSGGSFPTDPLQRGKRGRDSENVPLGENGRRGEWMERGRREGLARLRPPPRRPAAKVLSSALWRRQGVGAGHHGPTLLWRGSGKDRKGGKGHGGPPSPEAVRVGSC